MAVILRSGRELDERRVEKGNTEKEQQSGIRKELEQHSSELLRKRKQHKCNLSSRDKRKKLKLTTLQFPSLKDYRKQSKKSSSLDS